MMNSKLKRPNYRTPITQNSFKNKNNTGSHSVEISGDESIDDSSDDSKRTIFCANLDERVTEELLYEAFLQAGPIERVHIPKDAKGQKRNYGFITYVHKCTLPYALELYQGLTLYRKTLVIKTGNACSSSSPSTSLQKHPISTYSGSKNYDNYQDRHVKRQRRNAYRPCTRPTQMDYNLPQQKLDEKCDWTRGSFGSKSGGMGSHFNFWQPYSSTSSNVTYSNGKSNKSVSSNLYTTKNEIDHFQRLFPYTENQYQNNKYKRSSNSNSHNNLRRK